LMSDAKFLEQYGIEPGLKGKTFIIQGLGKIGTHLSVQFVKSGAKMIGALERENSIYSDDGIDPEKLLKYRDLKKTIVNFPGTESFFDETVLKKKCDVLITAAAESVINNKNSLEIQCKVLVEASYAPTTVIAEENLTRRGVLILPDILVNGGALVVSYFEWLKNLEHLSPGRLVKRWEIKSRLNFMKLIQESTGIVLDDAETREACSHPASESDIVLSALEDVTITAVKTIKDKAIKHKVSLRVAGYMDAIEKIHQSYMEAGTSLS
jgi:glutamate dehydrogenase (NAD(P)+)